MQQEQKNSIMEKLLRDNSVKSHRETVESQTPERLDHVARTVQKFANKSDETIVNIEKTFEIYVEKSSKQNEEKIKKEEEYKKHEKNKREKMFYMFVGEEKTTKVSSGSFSWRFKKGIRSIFNRGDAVYEKLESKFTSTLNTIQTSVKAVTDTIKNVTKFLKNTVMSAFTCFKDILLGAFRFAWDAIDSLMTKLTGPVWDITKKVVSSVFSAFSWLWDVGKKMITFVWEGITTIFKVGYTVIAKAANILYKGAKGIFQWWFRLLLNTIFTPSPLLMLITIPLFVAISTVLFTVLASSVGVILNLTIPLINSLIDGGAAIFKWVWKGVVWIWDNIKNLYKGSVLETFIDGLWDDIQKFEVVQKILGYVDTVIGWVKTAYTWILTTGKKLYNSYIEPVLNTILDFFKDGTGKAYIVTILNAIGDKLEYAVRWLTMFPNFTGGVIKYFKYLDSRFGWLTGYTPFTEEYQIEEGDIRTDIATLKARQKNINKELIRTTIEEQVARLLGSGKNMEFIAAYIKDTIMPTFATKIDDFNLNAGKILEQGLSSGQKIFQENISRDYSQVYKSLAKRNAELTHFIHGITAGQIDATPANLKIAHDILLASEEEKTQTAKIITGKIQTLDFSERVAELNELENSALTSRVYEYEMGIQNQFYQNLKDLTIEYNHLRGVRNNIAETGFEPSSDDIVIPDKLLDSRLTVFNSGLKKKLTPEYLKTLKEKIGSITAKIEASKNNMPQKDGGVKFKNMKEPLDAQSLEYIKSKINKIEPSTLNININKKEKKPVSSVITIIEESVIKEESYETYTLHQLSRGILGS